MKKFRKIITFPVIIAITLSCIITFASENNMETCNHSFKYSSVQNGNFVYICDICGAKDVETPTKLLSLWDEQIYNEKASEVEDIGYFMDVVPDGIINAKDYAHIYYTMKYYESQE